MKKEISIIGLILSVSNPSIASPQAIGINVVTPNQAQNSQHSTGVINQAPYGGNNSNYQINNSYDTTYGFAPGIYCRTPSFNIGAYGSGSDSGSQTYSTYGNNFGVVVGLNIPISGEIGKACEQLATEIVKQRQLDTTLNFIRQCAILKREGIKFDSEVFTVFKACESVDIISPLTKN